MRNLDSELAYFRIQIGRSFAKEINESLPISDGAIRAVVEDSPFKLSVEERDEAIRELESLFTHTQKKGSAVTSDFKPWLDGRRQGIDFYYWNRLRRFYLEGGSLPPQVVATLDNVTDEILDYLGDPSDAASWSRRGMVIGHVQSGKTTNYSALICKAADAGYKVIILLAGITNSLRSQTQERLDETFIGRKSVFHATAQEALPIINYAGTRRFPAYGTSRDRDFTRDAAGVYFNLAAHNEPIIFITKKNKAPLESLQKWLVEQSHGQKIDFPLLLVDDEADNASINTHKNPKATTSINGAIRQILNLFSRSSYVGYTATPFANIFIDPDSNSEMLSDDLFPRNFIKELDPPSAYVGAARVFADSGDLRKPHVVVVEKKDFQDIMPLKHDRDIPITVLPSTLYIAVRLFVLARAVRILRGDGKKHCSMMINVSRFNNVQEKVLGLVYDYLQKLKNSIAVNGSLKQSQITDQNIKDMKVDFLREYGTCGFNFGQVINVANEAVSTIKPITVNMKGGKLDYQQNKANGLHVIAIGGLALSRGLTLEGLVVSYILRNAGASDTLMQMARWFGYRPNFEDLCRVYLPQESLDHYVEIHEAIEELRSEVRGMQVAGRTPREFGLRVRESPTAIRITAANKMRSASELTLAQDYSTRHIEGHSLLNDNDVNLKNLSAIKALVAKIEATGVRSEHHERMLFWSGVNGAEVVSLIKAFRFSEAHPDLGRISQDASLVQDYISDRLMADLKTWDVCVPHPTGGGDSVIDGYSFQIRERNSGDVIAATYRVTGSKHRVADPNDARLGLSDEQVAAGLHEKKEDGGLRGDRAFCSQRTRPLLLVHVFKSNGVDNLKITGPIVSLSLCFPPTKVAAKSRIYQVNKVYQKQILDLFSSQEDDDEPILEGAADV